MNSLSSQIEELILQHDHRGMARLRHNLRPGYCQRSAELLLDNKGFENGNCPRIAFGDGGNEIGMGNLQTRLTAMDIIPSVTPCDELVISSVSNWGVYGVIGVMSQLLNEDLFKLIDPESIASFLMANGCVDGITHRPESTEDGFPLQVGISIIRQIRKLLSAQKKWTKK